MKGFSLKIKTYRKYSAIAVILILITTMCSVNHRWEGNNWQTTINSDGRGYYAYLPAIFIDGNFTYHTPIEQEKIAFGAEGAGNYLRDHNGSKANQFFAGISMLLLPFFVISYFLSWLLGYTLTGYSELFQYSVSVSAIFYLLVGLIFLRKLLLIYVRETPAALAILFFGIGTNLFYYAHWEPCMSHTYSFAAISMFIYFGKKYFEDGLRKHFFIACLVLAIIILLRPINAIVVFALPFLAGDIGTFKVRLNLLFKNSMSILPALFVFALLIFIQPLLFFFQTGSFFLYSYGKEGFDFSHPEIFNVLFGYRKGLFIYAPITFISLFGLPFIFKESRFRFFALAAFLILVIYITASWWCWWYGDSFGSRAFIDFYSILALMLAFFFNSIKNLWIKFLSLFVCSFFTYLNLVQTFQYKHFILHWSEMNKERYWQVFMNTHKKYMGIYYRQNMDSVESIDKFIMSITNDMENQPEKNKSQTITAEKSHSGKYASKIDNNNKFSEGITRKVSEINQHPKIRIKLSVWAMRQDENSDAQLVVSLEDTTQKVYSWTSFPLTEHSDKTKEWEKLECEMIMPTRKSPDDVMKIYMWSPTGQTTYVDDFEIDFYGF